MKPNFSAKITFIVKRILHLPLRCTPREQINVLREQENGQFGEAYRLLKTYEFCYRDGDGFGEKKFRGRVQSGGQGKDAVAEACTLSGPKQNGNWICSDISCSLRGGPVGDKKQNEISLWVEDSRGNRCDVSETIAVTRKEKSPSDSGETDQARGGTQGPEGDAGPEKEAEEKSGCDVFCKDRNMKWAGTSSKKPGQTIPTCDCIADQPAQDKHECDTVCEESGIKSYGHPMKWDGRYHSGQCGCY